LEVGSWKLEVGSAYFLPTSYLAFADFTLHSILSLPTSHFKLPHFRLHTSDFRLLV
jgi:hypothetical protein